MASRSHRLKRVSKGCMYGNWDKWRDIFLYTQILLLFAEVTPQTRTWRETSHVRCDYLLRSLRLCSVVCRTHDPRTFPHAHQPKQGNRTSAFPIFVCVFGRFSTRMRSFCRLMQMPVACVALRAWTGIRTFAQHSRTETTLFCSGGSIYVVVVLCAANKAIIIIVIQPKKEHCICR